MGKPSRYLPILLFSIGILVSVSAAAQAETFNLELKKMANASMMMMNPSDADYLYRRTSGTYVHYDPQGNRYGGQEKITDVLKKDRDSYDCKFPFKGVIKLGEDKFAFTLDSTNIMSKGYDRLYFDLNKNGDLTDEKVIEANKMPEGINFGQGSSQREFPIQEVELQVDGKTYKYAFMFSVYTNMRSESEGPSYARANANPASYRQGEIEIGGEKHKIVLIDFNSNGRFDNEYEINDKVQMGNGRIYPQPGDKIFLDPDTSNMNTGYYIDDRPDTYPVAKLLPIGDKFYNLSVTPSGDQITVTPSSIPTGKATNPNKKYFAAFYGDKGIVKVNGEAGKEVLLPEGDWKLMGYTIDVTEDSSSSNRNRRRTLVAAYGTKNGPTISIKNGQTAKLPFGPPYKPLVEVQDRGGSTSQNRNVSLALLLQGTGEEICRALSVNGSNPDAPSFVIATTDNEIVERGAFEYG